MIDPCIYKVYKRDKKVFIPEFGAIIYSEASDTLDFNDLLTFDDGKVIEEIKAKHKLSEEKAREKLEEHVSNLKTKLEEGKSHLIRGLGYLFKNEQGSYAIQKSKPKLQPTSDAKPEDSEFTPPVDIPEQSITAKEESSIEEDKILNEPEEAISPEEVEPDLIVGSEFEEPEENSEEESSTQETNSRFNLLDDEDRPDDDEQPFTHQPVLAEEDEDIQEYYKRKDDYYSDEKSKRPLVAILAAVLAIIVIAAGLFYYFNYYSSDIQLTNNDVPEASSTAMSKNEADAQIVKTNAVENTDKSDADIEIASKIQNTESNERKSVETVESAKPTLSDYSSNGKEKHYSLILGSFKVEHNANRYQEQLEGRGLEVSIFRRGGPFHFVGYEEIAGKSNAVRILAELREDEPAAWIIRKQQF